MSNSEDHQRLRELLGSFALGHLSDADRSRVQAHLDGCASCRADLAEIEPLAELLDTVDAQRFDLPALPPGDLGSVIRSQVAGERQAREADDLEQRREGSRRRAATRAALGAVAAAVVLAVLAGGFALGRGTAPETVTPTPAPTTETVTVAPPEEPAVTVEPVALTSERQRIRIEDSGLIAHTWGVELVLTGRGFSTGEQFQAYFRDSRTGELVTAGAFVGTGRDELVCNLQSALLRAETSEVVVTDASGDVVLTAPL